jgi:type II secretory pathway component GspD/PulD (secretin)
VLEYRVPGAAARRRPFRIAAAFIAAASALLAFVPRGPSALGAPGASASARPNASPNLRRRVDVFPAGGLGAEHAASVLRRLYPHATLEAERTSDAVIAVATPAELNEMRRVMRALVAGAPAPAASAAPKTLVVDVTKAAPTVVARAVQQQVPSVHVTVLGSQLALGGPPDDVDRAAALVSGIDAPAPKVAYSQIYRLRSVDAGSVAALLQRSFPGIVATPDAALNAITVLAPPAQQDSVVAAIQQVEGGRVVGNARAPIVQPGSASPPVIAADGSTIEVVTLRAAVPGAAGAASTSAADIANALVQTLARSAPTLKVSVVANSPQLVLNGSQQDVALAKDLIEQLDVAQKLVVLDTEIYEVDESAEKNLGLGLTTAGSTYPYVGTTYGEVPPAAPLTGGTAPPLLGLQALTRTPLSLGLQLNLLVSRGKARVLANPRITTISGRTATIRAGDNLTVLTTAGGAAGTVATTQLQTFQTGVTLDITPIVNAGNFISVTLHPTVNSLTGTSNGIPQISTRDTSTTVAMQAEQSLVIGGLIQDSANSTETKIPLLGDLPLIGRVFRQTDVSHTRNELIIVVTPHIVTPGEEGLSPRGGALPTLPPWSDLPTLPPETHVISRPVGRGALPRPLAPLAPVLANSPSPAPLPAPSAFGQANTFTFGKPPQNTYAKPSDPIQIFFVTLNPTVLHSGTPMRVAAITTSNVAKVTLASSSVTEPIFGQGGGFWQGNIPFDPIGLFPGDRNVILTLTATKADGTTATVQIPVSYAQ